MSIIYSPSNFWKATESFANESVKAFKIEATDEKVKGKWEDFQSLCNELEKGYTFSTHHRVSDRQHTLVVHADFLTSDIRGKLAALTLLPPLTPPPPTSEK